jgi:hypothetical protein
MDDRRPWIVFNFHLVDDQCIELFGTHCASAFPSIKPLFYF